MTYLDCWIGAASALFSQALAGEPRLEESLPRPMNEGTLAFTATIGGDPQGRFTVVLERGILDVPLLGEGVDQQGAWGELLREAADAACSEMLARGGQSCRVEAFESGAGEAQVTAAFQLKCTDRAWTILVRGPG